jgi:glycosyltransferase involved in cell wall biosynthesis
VEIEMEPLHILQIADHSEIISGGATQMLLLARGLVERGHRVTCVFDDTPSRLESTLGQVEAVGARLVRLPMQKKTRRSGLRELIQGESFDVIHTHRAAYKVLLRTCSDVDLPPVVINRGHSRPVRDRELRKLQHPAVRAMVVVAASIKDVLVQGGVDSDRIEVVYGSFPPDRFDRHRDGSVVRQQLLQGTDQALVGLIAKLSHYKSHDVFLLAAARVLQQRGDVVFALVGPDTDGVRRELESLADHLEVEFAVPLRRQLRFTGPRQDIPQVLAALDVSVSASATPWEGLSGVMRESLAMARPVVCTDVGGNRELVRDGQTGLLVPPGDAAALARAILRHLDDPQEAARMADNGWRLVQEEFSNAARARTMEALYRRLLAEAHSS